jgi:diacylglycerol kinase family enzyme
LLLFGRFHKSDDFETFAASSVEVITRRKRLSVALDGDVAPLSTPLHYRSLPGALTVMCPLESSMHADSAAVENAAV